MNVKEKRSKVAMALLKIKEQHNSVLMQDPKENFFVDMIYYTEAIQYVTITLKGKEEKYLISMNRAFLLEKNVSAMQKKTDYSKFVYNDFIMNLNKCNFDQAI